ncbi:hypothetical protein J3Q64DRAFT_1770008 [Phycomyces blakesleeanus]|uniref:Uncharacterized protein n=1 Tax=Phycomyces blakesleeanus TaxID=4837 RepID=A0ABR3ALD9_PHYBL
MAELDRGACEFPIWVPLVGCLLNVDTHTLSLSHSLTHPHTHPHTHTHTLTAHIIIIIYIYINNYIHIYTYKKNIRTQMCPQTQTQTTHKKERYLLINEFVAMETISEKCNKLIKRRKRICYRGNQDVHILLPLSLSLSLSLCV